MGFKSLSSKWSHSLPGLTPSQVTSGKVYEGVFAGLGTEDGAMSIAIKYAKLIKDPEAAPGSEKETLAERPKRNLCIKPASLVQLIAKDVRFNALVRSAMSIAFRWIRKMPSVVMQDLGNDDRSDYGFETDSAISRGRVG